MTCRYCNQPITEQAILTHAYAYCYAYWDFGQTESRQQFLCHAECKIEGIKSEAFDCQMIDADCNDCRHFQRGQVVKRWLSCIENKKPSMRLVNMGIITGHCAKFNRPTTAQPNKWTGLECFEHRRAL